MALSIDPLTYVITVPKADLTLIQETPTEIRELNVNAFRLELKAYEDDEQGMYLPKTHTHNTETTLGGITFARVVEILDPYTVTFEDGQYAVNLVGANSNVGDRINVNQVSVRSANSAGLISSPDIEYSSFQGKVWIDPNGTDSGTTFPMGTPKRPVNNLADAMIICASRGFEALHVLDDMELDAGSDLTNFKITAKSTDVMITLSSSLQCTGVTIENAHIVGTLDGNTHIVNCIVGDMIYFNGNIDNSGLYGTIYLDGDADAVLNNCYTVDQDSPPVIDMGDSGQSLAMPNYSGMVTVENLDDADAEIGIGLNHGLITLDSSIVSGTVIISGIGILTDNSTATVNDDGLINRENIFLASAIHNGTAQGSGTSTNQIQLATTASSLNGAYDPAIITIRTGTGAGQTREIYQYNGTTRTATVDRDWRISPDATSTYVILPHPGREHVNEGLAQGGTTSTITLNASASSIDDAYVGQLVFLRSGTGADQVGYISAYNGTTKVATVSEDWAVTPDTTSAYVLLPTHSHTLDEMASSVWDEQASAHTDIGSMGEKIKKIDTNVKGLL